MRPVPRSEAATVLAQVLSERHPLDEVLRRSTDRLGAAERAWLWDVCSGVLRYKPRLDLALDSLALKKKPSGRLRRYLLIAAYQIFFQDSILPERVVDETVGAIKKNEGAPPANFANALLRKLIPQRALWRDLPIPAPELQGERLRAYTGLPDWFQDRLEKQRGREFLLSFARETLHRPVTWVRSAQGRSLPEGGPFQKGDVPGAYRLEGLAGGFENLPGFHEGAFYAQDLSSQMAIQEVSRLFSRKGRALDLCAAPGGKSFHLEQEGWQVLATDHSEKRLDRLRENALRLQSHIEITSYEQALAQGGGFSLVWVDAPCSGSGIIRRHPDAKYLHDDEQIGKLKRTQQELLSQAASRVAPGGALVFSVCSVFKDEAEDQIQAFLQTEQGKGFRLDVEKLIAPQSAGAPDGLYYAVLSQR